MYEKRNNGLIKNEKPYTINPIFTRYHGTGADCVEKILIIDDSRISQALVAEIFDDTYVLEFRSDGPTGLAAARELSPDLILLDIHMPEMDGFEVCRALKSDERTREIPVIFITSLDSESEKVKGFAAGAEDYVVKPFHMEELEARVRAHLASRRAKVQALELERLTVFKEMAVAISHEINNPLTSIYAFLHVLQRDLADSSETVRNSLEGIREEVKRIQQITGRLAQASKAAKVNYSRDITMIDLHNI
jgi:DNA-binding response OmpR family regulator